MGVAVPNGIVLVNNDLVPQVRAHLIKQLHINEVLDGYVFDDIIAADPSYPTKVKQLGLRVMVIRPFTEYQNRQLFDLVIFIKNGMASMESKKVGPPARTFEVLNLHWSQFCIYF